MPINKKTKDKLVALLDSLIGAAYTDYREEIERLKREIVELVEKQCRSKS